MNESDRTDKLLNAVIESGIVVDKYEPLCGENIRVELSFSETSFVPRDLSVLWSIGRRKGVPVKEFNLHVL